MNRHLERKQKKREDVEGKKENRSLSSKVKYTSKYWQDTRAITASALILAKEARDSLAANASRASSNGKSRKDKCGCSISRSTGRVCA